MDILKDTALMIIQAVLLVAVPIIASAVVKLLKTWKDRLTAEMHSTITQECLDELSEAAYAAVAHTSQTYVDAIKGDNLFDLDAQKTALEKATSSALKILKTATKAFLEEHYDDFPALLEAKIEEAVREQKNK